MILTLYVKQKWYADIKVTGIDQALTILKHLAFPEMTWAINERRWAA